MVPRPVSFIETLCQMTCIQIGPGQTASIESFHLLYKQLPNFLIIYHSKQKRCPFE